MKLSLSRILLLSGIFLLAVVGLVVFVILNHSTKPLTEAERQAALVNILGRKPVLSNNEATGNVKYDGRYASFSYPAKAVVYGYKDPNIVKNNSELEMFSFDINNPRLVFNYSVSENSGGIKSAKESSGAIFRQDKTNGYSQVELSIGQTEGFVFSKQGSPAEKTGFWLTKNKLYTFSVTGSDYAEVAKLFDDVIESVEFK